MAPTVEQGNDRFATLTVPPEADPADPCVSGSGGSVLSEGHRYPRTKMPHPDLTSTRDRMNTLVQQPSCKLYCPQPVCAVWPFMFAVNYTNAVAVAASIQPLPRASLRSRLTAKLHRQACNFLAAPTAQTNVTPSKFAPVHHLHASIQQPTTSIPNHNLRSYLHASKVELLHATTHNTLPPPFPAAR